jgi:hypothetical protein
MRIALVAGPERFICMLPLRKSGTNAQENGTYDQAPFVKLSRVASQASLSSAAAY